MSTGLAALTLIRVVISLIGIVSGLVVTYGLLRSQGRDGWTALFLVMTVATSVTGFFFPFTSCCLAHSSAPFRWCFWHSRSPAATNFNSRVPSDEFTPSLRCFLSG